MASLMLYVISVAQFLDIMNGSAMTVAFVDISRTLDFDTYSTQWIMSSYAVAFGGFLLLAGRVGDMYGHRSVFLVGQIWFGLWSLIVSFSTSPAMFCITRALQGIGASMSVPTALGLITTTIPAGPKRTRALSIFGGFGAAGAVVGLLLAGALISAMSWHWIFRFSSIFSFVLFALGFFAIPSTPKKQNPANIDVAGALTATSSLICIIYYISAGSATGWASVQTLPVLAAGLVLFTAFIWIEMRWVSNPIMPFRIWHLKNFSSAFIAIMFLQGQFQGYTYYATLIFQNVMGYTSMQTSLAFLAHSLAAIVTFTVLGKILPKYRLKPFILTGFVFRCASAIMFAFVTTKTSYWTLPFLGLLVHVIGVGTSVLPAQITALKDAKNEDQGVVGALYSTGMQLGGPLGLAIVTAISENSVSAADQAASVDMLMESYRNGLFGVVGLGVLGIIVSAILLPNNPTAPATPPADAATDSVVTDDVAGVVIEPSLETTQVVVIDEKI
ncbi:major facilitator superfamily domain-containing protein [Dissophora ornata]|nr:major facilitator superfamily domain-containing protein [Dissophora ornata]